MNKNLVIDLGFLNGEDSAYYMSKGFDVVAVEASPLLYEAAKFRFTEELSSGKLKLHNRVITDYWRGPIAFYANKERPEVSSTEEWIASQNDKYETVPCLIDSMGFHDLIFTCGIPYYLKVDIEGMDKTISDCLLVLGGLPRFVSFELNKVDYEKIFSNLKAVGYTKFQLVNQIHNKPNSSGPFGEFLDQDKWLDFDTALERYMKYRELKMIDNVNLGVGWIDLHASL